MTDLATMHLKCLLEKATDMPLPTTYTYKGGAPSGIHEEHRDKDSLRVSMNLSPLAQAAPALAQEVIRLRENIEELITAMEEKAAIGESQSPAIIAGYLKEKVLGDTND